MDQRNRRAVRAGYDRIAAEYAQRSFQESAEEPIDHKILDLLVARVEGVVCDLGCGPGHHVRYLRERGVQEVVGVDLSAGMLEQVRLRSPGIDFIQASMDRLPVGYLTETRFAIEGALDVEGGEGSADSHYVFARKPP